jgi:hypothetical protein
MFKSGDRLKVKSHVTRDVLMGIGFSGKGADLILAGVAEYEGEGYSAIGEKRKYIINVLGYSHGCWIYEDWIRPKNEQLTFIFTE